MPSDVLQGCPVCPDSFSIRHQKASDHFHDESSFHSNDDQRFTLSHPDPTAIKPKSRGSKRMVIDFKEEYSGYLRLTPTEMVKAAAKHRDIPCELN